MNQQVYSLLKASEGGVAQKDILLWLKEAGITAKKDYSPYIGHYGIRVIGTKRQLEKADKIIFPR